MNDLARIHTFIDVVKHGSFSAAARQQGTSVTSIARQITSLEKDLGVRLMQRSSRQLSLTEPGKLFYARSCVLAADLRQTIDDVASLQSAVRGTLRICLRPAVGSLVIVPALTQFLATHPELKIHLSLSDTRQDLIANDIDVAVWMGAIHNSDVVARRLTKGRRILCASPQYLERRGTPQQPQELTHHSGLLFDAPTYGDKWFFTRGDEHHEIPINGVLQTDSAPALYAAAQAGVGIVVAHEWAALPLIAQGSLVQVLREYEVSYSRTDSCLYAVYASNKIVSPKIRSFVDFLVDLFQETWA